MGLGMVAGGLGAALMLAMALKGSSGAKGTTGTATQSAGASQVMKSLGGGGQGALMRQLLLRPQTGGPKMSLDTMFQGTQYDASQVWKIPSGYMKRTGNKIYFSQDGATWIQASGSANLGRVLRHLGGETQPAQGEVIQ